MSSYRNPSYRLKLAVQENNLPLVVRLRYKTDLRNTDSRRLTSLAWAALSGSEDVFEWLLFDAGHDEEELSRDQENSTILHLLASLPHPVHSPKGKKPAEMHRAAVRMANMYLDMFPRLIDWSDTGGKTALHCAAQSGNVELVRTLCEMGADLDLTDVQGNTPMHYAAAWNQLPIIRLLLEFGTFGHQLPNNGRYLPIDYAFSLTLQKDIQTAIREVQEERRVRRKASSQHGTASPSLYGGATSPGYPASGPGVRGLRTVESRATMMSDGASSVSGYYAASPGQEYAMNAFGMSNGGGGGNWNGSSGGSNGARSPTLSHRPSASWLAAQQGAPPSTPPLVQLTRAQTKEVYPSPGSAPPSTPRKDMLPSPQRVQALGSPLSSPAVGPGFRPPPRGSSSGALTPNTPGRSPAVGQGGSFGQQQQQHMATPVRTDSGDGTSPVRGLGVGVSPTMSRERTPTPMDRSRDPLSLTVPPREEVSPMSKSGTATPPVPPPAMKRQVSNGTEGRQSPMLDPRDLGSPL